MPSWDGVEEQGEDGIDEAAGRIELWASLRAAVASALLLARRDVLLAQAHLAGLEVELAHDGPAPLGGMCAPGASYFGKGDAAGAMACVGAIQLRPISAALLDASRTPRPGAAGPLPPPMQHADFPPPCAPLLRLLPDGAWSAEFSFRLSGAALDGATASGGTARCAGGRCVLRYPAVTAAAIRSLILDVQGLLLLDRMVGGVAHTAAEPTAGEPRLRHASAARLGVECAGGRLLRVDCGAELIPGSGGAHEGVKQPLLPGLRVRVTIDGQRPMGARLQAAADEMLLTASLHPMVVALAS